MKFEDYIEEIGISVKKFAQKSGLSYSQVIYITRGNCPSLKIASAIEEYTKTRPTLNGDYVRCEDFLDGK